MQRTRRVKYTNFLVRTDGTALMDAVFDECAYLARLMEANIHVAYMLDVTDVGAQSIDATWEERYVTDRQDHQNRHGSRTRRAWGLTWAI